MTRMAAAIVPEKSPAPPESFAALRRDFRIDMCRLTPSMPVIFPAPGQTDFALVDKYVDALTAAEISVYLNPTNVPPFASGGIPAFVPGIGGSAAWWLYTQAKLTEEQIRDVFERADAFERRYDKLNAPALALKMAVPDIADTHVWHFETNYRNEQKCTWAWDKPLDGGGDIHTYGAAGHEDADAISAPRPWALDPKLIPRVDLEFLRWAGGRIGTHFGPDRVKHHGYGNEFGNADCFLPIRFDGANYLGGEDMVRTRVVPMVHAYNQGLRVTRPYAKLIGGEHDGTDIMRRCLETIPNEYDIFSFHPYPTSDPAKVGEYVEIARRVSATRTLMIGEIAGDEMATWLRATLTNWPELYAICLLEQEWRGYFVDFDAGGEGLGLTPKGRAVKAVIDELVPPLPDVAKRRRAASHP